MHQPTGGALALASFQTARQFVAGLLLFGHRGGRGVSLRVGFVVAGGLVGGATLVVLGAIAAAATAAAARFGVLVVAFGGGLAGIAASETERGEGEGEEGKQGLFHGGLEGTENEPGRPISARSFARIARAGNPFPAGARQVHNSGCKLCHTVSATFAAPAALG